MTTTVRPAPFAIASAVLPAVALLLAVASITRGVLAGPGSVPDEKDRTLAGREVASPRGGDERGGVPPLGSVSGSGIVEPADRESRVAPVVAGRIARILVKEGDKVAMGDALVELEGAVERAALAACEADVRSAEADLARVARGQRREDVEATVAEAESATARARDASETAARTAALVKGGAATADEGERAKRAEEAAAATAAAAEARKRAALAGGRWEDVAAGRAKVAAALARRDQARAALERLTVRAPIAGEILALKYRAGEYVLPGSGDALVVLGDTTKLRARLDIDEREIARVRVGQAGYVTALGFGGRRFSGKVTEVGRRMGRKNVRTDDPAERIDTKILEVVLELETPQDLVPGLRVTGVVGSP